MRRQRLEIRDLSLGVRLGCTAAERRTPQEVRFSLELEFVSPPEATRSDRLEDTVCYAKLCERIAGLVENREFATVERLAEAAREAVQAELEPKPGQGVSGRLRVHKVRPPVPGLQGGVIYELGLGEGAA